MPTDAPRFLLFTYFQQGGIAMYPLLLCSIVTFAIAIERIIAYARTERAANALRPVLEGLLTDGKDIPSATEHCAGGACPLARTVQVALATNHSTPTAREKAIERAVTRETGELERYLPVLATIGSVSPFIGLFGTVLGIMRAFHDIGSAGSAGGAVVAAGISEALIATAAGLFVAVTAVVAYNHLMTWAQAIITTTELDAEELAALVEA